MLVQNSHQESARKLSNELDAPESTTSSTVSSLNSLPEEETDTCDDIHIVGKLSKSKNPIFLAKSSKMDKEYAMKVFYFKENQICNGYLNESRFICLSHPNIVSMVDAVDEQEAFVDGKPVNFSYILMDLALCDFYDLMKMANLFDDEKLARTYFHHLIEGLQYLHFQGICHLDLKLQNLLLGEDLQLKITDFDLSFLKGDKRIQGRGSDQFRAPEIKAGFCFRPEKADIFSAGILLFVLRCGYMPYMENYPAGTFDLYRSMFNDPETFWNAHSEIDDMVQDLAPGFKELFMSMTQKEPEKRASLEDIKKNLWYQGAIYSNQELSILVKKLLENGVVKSK